MDIFRMLMGICFILVSIIILIIQIRDGTYLTKEESHIGDVKLTFAGLMSLVGGLYYLITSFSTT